MNEALSILGKRWIFEPVNDRDALHIQQKYNLSPVVAEIILKRGISVDQIESYLTPTIKNTLKDPSLLKDMDKCVERVIKALTAQEKIVIYADYDVDGATSSALLRRYFLELGIQTGLYIPDRLEEGYGANPKAMELLKNQGYSLVLMCDCGTTSFEALKCAKDLGLDVIVLDHHSAEIELPDCFGLINPHRLDQDLSVKESFGILCAAGIAFCFLAALNRSLNLKDHKALPNLLNYLDFVALGTVCDVMPLKGVNRAIVAQGLKLMQKRQNKGLNALMKIAGVNDKPTSYHFGFCLGPRINAGGRVGKADMGSNLLTAKDDLLATALAEQLNHYNQERQTIELITLEQAYTIIEEQKLNDHPILVVAADGWHPGVIGIVASRLKDRFDKPTIVIAFEDENGKGSGRSVPGVDLGPAMHDAVHQGILTKGGGHAMAVGISIQKDQIDRFRTFLCDRFKEVLCAYKPLIKVDHRMAVPGVTLDLAKSLMVLEPFGQGNPTPKFQIDEVRPVFVMPVGDGHFRLTFQDKAGSTLEAMAFRVRGTALEKTMINPNTLLSILGTIKYDTWNGKEKVTFFLEDAREL